MTQPELDFSAPARETLTTRQRKLSLTDKLERFLMAHVGQFVSVTEMADITGHSGVRQRRLECEQRGVLLKKTGDRGEFRGLAYGFVVLGRRGAVSPRSEP